MKQAGVRHKSSWGGAEEEMHQLQFVQKHLPGMLEALAHDTEEGKVGISALIHYMQGVAAQIAACKVSLIEPTVGWSDIPLVKFDAM